MDEDGMKEPARRMRHDIGQWNDETTVAIRLTIVSSDGLPPYDGDIEVKFNADSESTK